MLINVGKNGGMESLTKIGKGLRQECPLSPMLLKNYLQQILKKWRRQCKLMGVTVANNNFSLCSVLMTK